MSRTYRLIIFTTCMRTMIVAMMAVLISSCDDNEQENICKLGELQTCPCIGGGQSIQECTEDRQGWSLCQCASREDQSEGNGGTNSGGTNSGDTDGGGTDGGGTDDGDTDGGGMDGGGMDGGGMDGGGTDGGGTDGGVTDSGDANDRSVTIWAHTFNGALGPGSGLQPGNMETQGEQGFTDGGSWISTGGWLSKTISTVGYNTIKVGYLLTKDLTSTCELNMSVDGGNIWTNILSDTGSGGYRMNGTLPTSAEEESQVLIRWTSETAWCWMNEIIITALETDGI